MESTKIKSVFIVNRIQYIRTTAALPCKYNDYLHIASVYSLKNTFDKAVMRSSVTTQYSLV